MRHEGSTEQAWGGDGIDIEGRLYCPEGCDQRVEFTQAKEDWYRAQQEP